jgi:hydroxymethylglutaryl-CoA synthase
MHFSNPIDTVEYPTVDGALSQTCYYQALGMQWVCSVDKMEKLSMLTGVGGTSFTAESPDYLSFTLPTTSCAKNPFARLYL